MIERIGLPVASRRAVLRGAAGLGLVALGSRALAQGAGGSAVVETTTGQVRGFMADGAHVYRGIRYGASTAGPNRFLPPQPVAPWTGVYEATRFGQTAPQVGRPAIPDAPFGEDCLVLNVNTPSPDRAAKRPVMVWLHGGGWRVGSASSEVTGGSRLAMFGDVVVVTLNHRLSMWGHVKIDDGDERFADSGNTGVLDMIAALQWVQANIEAFGGDPANVTIFGVSGGASKVGALMATERASGLFHKVILQSCSGGILHTTPEEADYRAYQLARRLDMPALSGEALQALPLERLLAAMGGEDAELNSFRPITDQRTFHRHPFFEDAPAFSAHLPMIAGNMATETTAHMSRTPELFDFDLEQIRRRLTDYLPGGSASTDRVLAAYAEAYPGETPPYLYAYITSDYRYLRNTRRIASLQAEAGQAPVYSYIIDWQTPAEGGRLRSPHGYDFAFVFGTTDLVPQRFGNGPELGPLSRAMMAAWTRFARTGNPDNPDMPHWPRFDAAEPTMMFHMPPEVALDPGGQARAALDPLPFYEYSMDLAGD